MAHAGMTATQSSAVRDSFIFWLPFHLQVYLMIPDGNQSSIHHSAVQTSERKNIKLNPHTESAAFKPSTQNSLHLIGQNLVSWP